jgi:hypothetical protein
MKKIIIMARLEPLWMGYYGPLLFTFKHSTDCTCCDFRHLRFCIFTCILHDSTYCCVLFDLFDSEHCELIKNNQFLISEKQISTFSRTVLPK